MEETALLAEAKTQALASLLDEYETNTTEENRNVQAVKREKPTRTRRRRGGRRPRARPPPDHLTEGQLDSAEIPRPSVSSAEVEYIPEQVDLPEGFGEMAEVLDRFAALTGKKHIVGGELDDGDDTDDVQSTYLGGDDSVAGSASHADKEKVCDTDDERTKSMRDKEDDSDDDAVARSRTSRKKNRITVAELKAMVSHPELVEQWDVTAADYFLLLYLKSIPGSVPVPVNWRHKRKYLQGKRGMEKKAFQPPSYIEATGVGAAREAAAKADAAKTAKQKGRERIRPKTSAGVDIDFSVLRDAFFKFQTKPRLTGHGDLYYELREQEVDASHFVPGRLSSTLRDALGMRSPLGPPPWLVAMQRYGPPPSYPGLVVPGLNAPIPQGAEFGYHPGGWGKPPVDELGVPVYGDVFGEGRTMSAEESRFDLPAEKKGFLWGELASVAEDDGRAGEVEDGAVLRVQASDRSESGGALGGALGTERTRKDAGKGGDVFESDGDTSGGVAAEGLATPAAAIELRKGPAPGQLYSVLPEMTTSVETSGIMGSSHGYDVAAAVDGEKRPESAGRGDDERNGKALPSRKRSGIARDDDEGPDSKKPREGNT